PTEVILTVVASGTPSGKSFALAMATMQRARRALYEELWAQFFVDDVFVDVVRVLEIDQGIGTDAIFVARSWLPDLHLDGQPHRARVRIVSAVARVVPRATGEAAMGQAKGTEETDAVEASADFVATLGRGRRTTARPAAR